MRSRQRSLVSAGQTLAVALPARWDALTRPAMRCTVLFVSALAVASSLAGCGRGGPASTAEDPATAVGGTASGAQATGAADGAAGAPPASDQPDVTGEGATSAASPLSFQDVTATSGVDFVHQAGYTDEKLMPEIMGGGVAAVDINRDGAPDLVFVNSGFIGRPRSDDDANRLYLNDGDGTFRDATLEWGLPTPEMGYGYGVAAGDYDNDGWTDLFLTAYGGGEMLLRNTGSGMVDVTADAGIEQDGGWGTSAGFLDLDSDGDLDLWLQRFVAFDQATTEKCYNNTIHIYCTPNISDVVPDRLLRNNGDGTFQDISAEAGLTDHPNLGLALAIADIDGDGNQDVYVANDISRNQLWLSDGNGGLTEVGRLYGVAYGANGLEEAGMGADVGDVDGDGRSDIAVANFQDEPTSIYMQGGERMFREQADPMGVGMTARTRLSWGIDFFDGDNDGGQDLLVANGHLWDNAETFASGIIFRQPNSLYYNAGDGRFTDVTEASGGALAARQSSRGLATADLDGDGRLDFVVANNNEAPQIARNTSEPAGRFVTLWLEGVSGNRSAIGARVEAAIGERTLYREVMGASSYLSVPDRRIHLGLGDAEAVDGLTIRWPGGAAQEFGSLPADAHYRIVEGAEPQPYTPGSATIEP